MEFGRDDAEPMVRLPQRGQHGGYLGKDRGEVHHAVRMIEEGCHEGFGRVAWRELSEHGREGVADQPVDAAGLGTVQPDSVEGIVHTGFNGGFRVRQREVEVEEDDANGQNSEVEDRPELRCAKCLVETSRADGDAFSMDLMLTDTVELIRADAWRMQCLAAVAALDLPDSYVGAGFLRNAIWDLLHEKHARTPLNDVDVVYFDSADVTSGTEAQIEAALEDRVAAHR